MQSIPNEYICRRLIKNAKIVAWDKNSGPTINQLRSTILWRHEMTRKSYNLILESERNENARKLLEDIH